MKKRILFAGASGYGNLGDDAYRTLFQSYLGKDHELTFTHPYPDMSLLAYHDYLVIGGGGLIYDNETAHFEYMTSYIESAIAHNVPFAFIACGVQVKMRKDDHEKWKQIAKWRKYLELADVVCVRSRKGKEFIEKVAPNANVKYYPDLVYLLKPVKYHLTTPKKVCFVPTPTGIKTARFKELWKKYEDFGKNRVVLATSASDYDAVMELGQKINDHRGLNEFTMLSPREAMSIMNDCEIVVSCRYHGHVMGHALGKEVVNCDTRFKSTVEEHPKDIMRAFGHIKELRAALAKCE